MPLMFWATNFHELKKKLVLYYELRYYMIFMSDSDKKRFINSKFIIQIQSREYKDCLKVFFLTPFGLKMYEIQPWVNPCKALIEPRQCIQHYISLMKTFDLL